jgi:hypothetical protein
MTEANPKQAALITLRALRNFGEVSGQKVSLARTKAAGPPNNKKNLFSTIIHLLTKCGDLVLPKFFLSIPVL